MAKIIGITDHFQHFVAELQESFWGDLQAWTRQAAQQFFAALSEPPPGASGYTCWWPTGCAKTVLATCWPVCAAGVRVRRTGKACSPICTAADSKARSCC
jgi:hypothetical protein